MVQDDEKSETKVVLKPVFPVQEPERQLSKKEMKAKEMAELDNVFAELGIDLDSKKEEPGASDASKRRRKKKVSCLTYCMSHTTLPCTNC